MSGHFRVINSNISTSIFNPVKLRRGNKFANQSYPHRCRMHVESDIVNTNFKVIFMPKAAGQKGSMRISKCAQKGLDPSKSDQSELREDRLDRGMRRVASLLICSSLP